MRHYQVRDVMTANPMTVTPATPLKNVADILVRGRIGVVPVLTPQGRVKLLDFGLARLRSEKARGRGLTEADSFLGTPEYVSPEQATDARTADIRADLYSLGCVLYEMLAGEPPFTGATVESVLRQQLTDQPPALTGIRAAVPEAVGAAVRRALAKRPADRFSTAVQFGEALSLPFAGVHIVEATKQVYRAIPAKRERLIPALQPVLVPSSTATRGALPTRFLD